MARAGAVLVCGGLGGAMEAACRGAKAEGGTTLGILPGTDRSAANPYVDVAVPTGLGEARNALVVRAADALIAVEGGYGTLSEIALALRAGKPVIGLGTWEIDGIVAGLLARRSGVARALRLRSCQPTGRLSSKPCANTPHATRTAERAGHKGGPGADPELREAIGDRALALDVPALTWGVDVGPEPTPFQAAQALAAEAWGARRSWFLINGASQGNHVALLTLRHAGVEVVVQRNAHSSTIDAWS